mgnify:CR=1 FL=1
MKSTLPRIPMTGILALAVLATALASTRAVAEQADPTTTMWYTTPARIWSREALPIGNGRLGCMIYGGIDREHIQFNEDTVWTGAPHDYAHPGAAEHYGTLCQAMQTALRLERENRWDEARAVQAEAEALAMKTFMSQPLGQMTYQPTGDLTLDFPGHEQVQEYRRALDLDAWNRFTTDLDPIERPAWVKRVERIPMTDGFRNYVGEEHFRRPTVELVDRAPRRMPWRRAP